MELTLEEMEAVAASDASQAPKPGDIKLEGDNIPDALKGKSVDDVVKQVTSLQDALKASEEARRASSASPVVTERVIERVPDAASTQQKDLTPEQIRELFEKDAVAGTAYMASIAQRNAESNINARLASLVDASTTANEAAARGKYKTEFELFEDDIKSTIASLPDKSQMAQPGAWDDVVTYVRGKNMDKLIAHEVDKRLAALKIDAQKKESSDAPGNLSVGNNPPPTNAGFQWDDTSREICKNMINSGIFKSEEEYIKWSRTNG